ncbi:MAG TPA: VOC family protein [Cyclobacteriaceae bacterium]|nr:VOC family protein [Cyclobacteriaceae bacterium]
MDIVPNVKLKGIQHVGIPVTHLLNSEMFYSRLGFRKVMQAGFESDGGQGIAVMLENNGIVIELYEMPASQIDDIRQRKNGHIDHIAFDVSDIDSVFKSSKGAGFEIEDDEPVLLDFWERGCRYFTVIGPDGERLEFNQIL